MLVPNTRLTLKGLARLVYAMSTAVLKLHDPEHEVLGFVAPGRRRRLDAAKAFRRLTGRHADGNGLCLFVQPPDCRRHPPARCPTGAALPLP